MLRTELALQYFPDKQPREAVRCLRRWIDRCPELKALLTAGDRKFTRCRDLTIRQVILIRHYLGDP